MRRYIKIIAALCLCLACAGLCGCNNNNTPADSTSDTTPLPTPDTTTVQPDDGKLHIIEGGKVKYDLITPILSDEATKQAAERLTNGFREVTGLKLKSFDDYVEVGQTHDDDTYEILLGQTSYGQSAQIYSGMKYNDYRVTVVGHKIVVAAYNEECLNAAVDWTLAQFKSALSGSGDSALLVLDGLEHSVTSQDYTVSSWTIGGNDLGLYRFVYSDANVLETLQKMRVELAQLTGYYLDIVKDTAEAGEYEILVGQTNRSESAKVGLQDYLHYRFELVGNKLVLRAGGMHSLAKTTAAFVSMFATDKTEVAIPAGFSLDGNYFDDPYNNTVMADGADIRVMSCNILAEYESYNGRIPVVFRKEVFFAALDYYQPTIIGIQEFSPAWYECLSEYRDIDKYEIFEVVSPNGKDLYFTTILYRKDLLEVIDSGTHKYSVGNNMRGRCVSWGLFKVRATGKVFGFTSTHLDGFDSPDTDIQIAEWAEIVHKLAESGPVMATGDFNTAESMNDFNDIQTSSGMRDLRYDCEVRLNEEGSYHDLGNPMSGYGLALDHIFATQNAIGKRFEMLIFNEQIWGSDHSWVLCDVALN